MYIVVVRLLKYLAIVVATVVALLMVLTFVLNSSSFQNRLMSYSTRLLGEKLQTAVSIDSVSVGLFTQRILLRGVSIEDRQQRQMLRLDLLSVSLEWMPLLRKEVRVSSATVRGLHAHLYQPSLDSVANYQFVVDAFRKEKPVPDSLPAAAGPEEEKQKLQLDITNLEIDDVSLTYNDSHASLARLRFAKTLFGGHDGSVEGLEARFERTTKKGVQQCVAGLASLTLKEKDRKCAVDFSGLHFANDNGLPRKNKGKPGRGAFDDGHLNITAGGRLQIHYVDKDTLVASLQHLEAADKESGISLNDVQMEIAANKREASLAQVVIKLGGTTLQFGRAHLTLPSKKEQRQLAYEVSDVTGRVVLKDIAKPFAPVLSQFTIPLRLKCALSGDAAGMDFRNVSVGTADGRLQIAARGRIRHLSDKYRMAIHFDVSRMTAKCGTPEAIINQFPVKKFMMKQLHALGDISYTGGLDILWRKEQFRGDLHTELGSLNFDFTIDDADKYLFGKASTADLELGRAFDVPDLGRIVCQADFRYDISKPRTAQMRRQKGGKLPIGIVAADVDEVSWKKVRVRNLHTTIESDGAEAVGKVNIKGKRVDVLCAFSFTSTDAIKSKLKVKPGIKFHAMSEEDKQARDEKQRQQAEEKALRKQQKAEEKARRKQQQAEEKARRKQQKAEEKARRRQQKESGTLL